MTVLAHKRYLIVLFAVLLGALFSMWVGLPYERMRFMDISYSNWVASLDLLDQTCGKDKIMILGDSWSQEALDPRILGENVVNISFPGGGPTELYFVLKNRWHCVTPIKRIILSVSSHHFINDDGYWNGGMRNVVTLSDMRDVEAVSIQLEDYQLYKQFHFSGKDVEEKIGEFLKEIRFPTTLFAALRNGMFENRYKKNRQAYEFMTGEARGYYTRGNDAHIDKPEDKETGFLFSPSPVTDYYFDKLLALIAEKGIEIDFMNMPVSNLTWAAMHPLYIKGYEDYLKAKMLKYHVRMIGDYFPVLPVEDFIDNGHLKEFSAQIWSQKVAPLLQ